MEPEPKVNILLVDDRPENLVALESVLYDLDQNLVRATSGREALKHLLERDFAVILLDVQMPDMDGFETAGLIRARERTQHTPIVFLTAINKSDLHVTRGYSVGGVDYLFKPFAPEVLKAKVTAFVELSKKTKQLEAEVARRAAAEEEVRRFNEDLERRVAERTAALETANRELEAEIRERERAEAERTRLLEREQAARAEAEAAQQRLAFLGEASSILAGSLDYQVTLERVARLAVPSLADFCIVDLVEEDGKIRRVATAHADPHKQELLHLLERHYSPDWDSPPLLARVLRTGTREIVQDVDEKMQVAAARDEEHLRILRALNARSSMIVPLVARGHSLGVITFSASESGRRYGLDDLNLAEDLARRAAAAIDNACLFHEIQEAGRLKDEFLAMLAHELRNPLAAISYADYMLEEIGSQDGRVARLRSTISRQTAHLARLVDDLLDISRITRGKIELRKEPVDLGAVIRQAVETTSALIERRRHELSVSLPAEPVWVEADSTRLEQVLFNLLNNAAKYTEPGGRIWLSVEIEGGAEREGARERGSKKKAKGGSSISPGSPVTPLLDPPLAPREAVIRVRDTGVGIPPELLPRVFDLFTQAERTLDRSQGGLGIGLALVENLVRMHGGAVTASSAGPGAGSEFVVRLPVLPAGYVPAEEEAQGEGAALRERQREGHYAEAFVWKRPAPGATRLLRVMIVEDNRDASDTLTEILENWGHTVRVAADGAAAIGEAPRYAPEVVLLDIGLPGMDGYEVARWFRQESGLSDVLLVALTGYGQEDDRRRAREAGFDLHLTKPVEPPELQRVLESVTQPA
jgi:signal transduction histidine kinase/DNA-binding response OmpR family regulator